MSAIAQLRNRILEHTTVRRLLERAGIQARQYCLLIDLFDTLAGRYELRGAITTIGLGIMVGFCVFMSLFPCLIVLSHPSLATYILFPMGLTVFQLFVIVMGDAANSLLNPQEASVLAHMPIGGLTYAAAKASHLILVVFLIVTASNALPALAGLLLPGARWFFPLTLMLASYLAGFFLAFVICGGYGWLYHFVAPERLKGVAMGIQVSLFALVPMLGGAAGSAISTLRKAHLQPAHWAWFPPNWFVSIALLGHAAPGFHIWMAILAAAVTGLLIALGLRSFGFEYLARATMLVQGHARAADARPRTGWIRRLVRSASGSPAGTGACAFTGIMLRRDWNLKRQALPMVVTPIIAMCFIGFTQIGVSPFAPGRFAPLHALPHALAFMLLYPIALLSQTDQPQGAAVFLTLPFRNMGAFTRGVYCSLWLPCIGIAHLLLMFPAIWFWGWRDALLFVIFSTAMASLYLSAEFFLMDGLPFANPVRVSAQADLTPVMLISAPCAAVLAFLQWLIFRSHTAAFIATVAVALLALVLTRFSLRHMAKEFRANLIALGLGPSRLFKPLDSN
ncbi:MAG: hypothetical protein LAP85_24180 [Acidobacteriia bacterium]|nr:hypothetical protein [Terriglobia bacterium]